VSTLSCLSIVGELHSGGEVVQKYTRVDLIHAADHSINFCGTTETKYNIDILPILADPVAVQRVGNGQCETVSQPSIQPDKVD